MNYTKPALQEFLTSVSPSINCPQLLCKIVRTISTVRYHGSANSTARNLAFVAILYEGQARLLGYAPQTKVPETLQLLQPGAVLG